MYLPKATKTIEDGKVAEAMQRRIGIFKYRQRVAVKFRYGVRNSEVHTEPKYLLPSGPLLRTKIAGIDQGELLSLFTPFPTFFLAALSFRLVQRTGFNMGPTNKLYFVHQYLMLNNFRSFKIICLLIMKDVRILKKTYSKVASPPGSSDLTVLAAAYLNELHFFF